MCRLWRVVVSGMSPLKPALFHHQIVNSIVSWLEAGPAGLLPHPILPKDGKRVLLIEKGSVAARQGLRRCRRAVNPSAMYIALGVKAKLESTPHFRVTGIVFSSPNGSEVVTVPLPEGDVEKMEAGYSLAATAIRLAYSFERATELVLENGGSVIQGAAGN